VFTFVHHVHYLVSDLDAIVDFLDRSFGMRPLAADASPGEDHADKEAIREARYQVGATLIEFTMPLQADSKYGRRLADHGPHVMHVAWGVPSLDEASTRLAAGGVRHRSQVGPRGYRTLNIDLEDSLGTHIQLAEG